MDNRTMEHYFAISKWVSDLAGGPSQYIPEHDLHRSLKEMANEIRSGELVNVKGVYKMTVSGKMGSQVVSMVDAAKEVAEYINCNWSADEICESGTEFCEVLGVESPAPKPTFWDRVDHYRQCAKDGHL